MAILDRLRGLEVCVKVDGNVLTEYIDEYDELVALDDTAVYIEAVSGKNFVIAISFDTSFPLNCPALVSHIVIDGKLVRKSNFSAINFPGSIYDNEFTRKVSRTFEGVYHTVPGDTTKQVLKMFYFQPIVITEDAMRDIRQDTAAMKETGEIIVRIFRAETPVPVFPRRGIPLGDKIQTHDAKVHEKALKGEAKSHTTSFGAAFKTSEKSYTLTTLLDGTNSPIASFKFKYRSREALKSLLVIHTPSPEPFQLDREPNHQASSQIPPRSTPPPDMNDPETMRQFQEFLSGKNGGSSNSTVLRSKNDDDENKTDIKREKEVKPRMQRNTSIRAEEKLAVKRERRDGAACSRSFVDLTGEDLPEWEHQQHETGRPTAAPIPGLSTNAIKREREETGRPTAVPTPGLSTNAIKREREETGRQTAIPSLGSLRHIVKGEREKTETNGGSVKRPKTRHPHLNASVDDHQDYKGYFKDES